MLYFGPGVVRHRGELSIRAFDARFAPQCKAVHRTNGRAAGAVADLQAHTSTRHARHAHNGMQAAGNAFPLVACVVELQQAVHLVMQVLEPIWDVDFPVGLESLFQGDAPQHNVGVAHRRHRQSM